MLNEVNIEIDLEMTGEIRRYVAQAKQGDKAVRKITANLYYKDKEKYIIPEGCIVRVNIKKPDGKYCYNECSYTENIVTIILTNQALAVAGTAECDIEIRTTSGNEIISSRAFELEIEKSIHNDNALLSSNEMTALDKAISEMIQNTDSATEAANTAATGANEATQAANTATDAANTAATGANEATQAANAATEAANAAATGANEATQAANTATDAANTAATGANTATQAANAATEAANTAADAANAIVNKNIATTEAAGLVKSGGDVTVQADGKMNVTALNNIQIGGTNLLLNSKGIFKPAQNTAIDNFKLYQSSQVYLEKGKSYTLSGKTNGIFSNIHMPNTESDRCVIWMVSVKNEVSTIISDANTGTTGTSFVWTGETGIYLLRVNVYHPSATNTIEAWELKIERGNVATDYSSAVDDLQIGNGNLVRNSDFSRGFDFWSQDNVTYKINNDPTMGTYVTFSTDILATLHRIYTPGASFTFVSGKEYMISFDAKADAATTIRIGNMQTAQNAKEVQLSTTWNRYTIKYVATASGALSFVLTDANIQVSLTKIMLVQGNIRYADWSPARENCKKTLFSGNTYSSISFTDTLTEDYDLLEITYVVRAYKDDSYGGIEYDSNNYVKLVPAIAGDFLLEHDSYGTYEQTSYIEHHHDSMRQAYMLSANQIVTSYVPAYSDGDVTSRMFREYDHDASTTSFAARVFIKSVVGLKFV